MGDPQSAVPKTMCVGDFSPSVTSTDGSTCAVWAPALFHHHTSTRTLFCVHASLGRGGLYLRQYLPPGKESVSVPLATAQALPPSVHYLAQAAGVDGAWHPDNPLSLPLSRASTTPVLWFIKTWQVFLVRRQAVRWCVVDAHSLKIQPDRNNSLARRHNKLLWF